MGSEYVQLAHIFKNQQIAGWFLSEKLDGTRAFWDGGISRGLNVEQVPYANKVKDVKEITATGLWSRTGKVIHAPDWWLDELPGTFLDGELWIGYGQFQLLRAVVSSHQPGAAWSEVKYKAFDIPPVEEMMKPRDIKVRNDYDFSILSTAEKWCKDHQAISVPRHWGFDWRIKALENRCPQLMVKQVRLSSKLEDAKEELVLNMSRIVNGGGEGCMLHYDYALWKPERSHHLLKVKPVSTDDAIVVGYTAGEGRLMGMVGALILDYNGKELKLSGFTDEQRTIYDYNIRGFAAKNPGAVLPKHYEHNDFRKGTVIEFKYRELSNDGIPKEARFLRIKDAGTP